MPLLGFVGNVVVFAVGAVIDRATFASEWAKCAVIDRAYSGSCLENVARLGVSFDFADG